MTPHCTAMHCVKPLNDSYVDMATAKISKFFWAKRGRWNAGECSLYGTGVITHSPLPIKALSLEIILSQFSDNPDLKNFVRSKF